MKRLFLLSEIGKILSDTFGGGGTLGRKNGGQEDKRAGYYTSYFADDEVCNSINVNESLSNIKPILANLSQNDTKSFCSAESYKWKEFKNTLSIKKGGSKAAFTLAEVLITLGIIGVVAALTMPALIANYQKQVWVTQLKKEYSTWSQAFQKILADEGVERLSDTQLWAKLDDSYCNAYTSELDSGCIDFLTALQKYIKFEIPSKREIDDTGHMPEERFIIKMYDGAISRAWQFESRSARKTPAQIETIKSFGGSMFSYIGTIQIDVNGDKKPNIDGRDLFFFFMSDEGRLYPIGGKDYALYWEQMPLESNSFYWKNHGGVDGCDLALYDYGHECAARIMEEGWKMNY